MPKTTIECLVCKKPFVATTCRTRPTPKYCSRECCGKRPGGARGKGDVTITCACCQTDFTVPWGQRKRVYCGRSCQAKSIAKTDIRTTSQCIICGEDFLHYGERMLCGRECAAIYMSQQRVGENNPAYTEGTAATCPQCGQGFSYRRIGLAKGRVKQHCSQGCAHKASKGKGKFGPVMMPQLYPYIFHKMKPSIKKRDNHTCLLCGLKEGERGHHVHHIDYDKKNNSSKNLITLCPPCHTQTNYNRFFWQAAINSLISGSKIVRKGWGFESHITNTPEYCLKYLVFFPGKKFSLHFHELKKELWHCLAGQFHCRLENNNVAQEFKFAAGDKIEIKPGLVHQLTATKHSILVEVSTRDFPEDSYRIIKGN